MKKKYFIICIILLLFTTKKVSAFDIKPSTLVFEKETEIRYLADDDIENFKKKFGLSDYDGAVIVTNENSISYIVDYSNSNIHPSNNDDNYELSYEEIENTHEFANYIAGWNGGGYSEIGALDIRRDEKNNLDFGYNSGIEYGFGFCGRKSDHNQQCYLNTITFDDEGFDYEIIDSSNGYITKFFVYYIKDITKSKLHFTNVSKKVNSYIPTALRDSSLIKNDKKYVIDESNPKYCSPYRGYLSEEDNKSIMDIVGMTSNEGTVELIPKTGFDFKLDLNKTTYNLNDIYEIDVQYYGITREGTKLIGHDSTTEIYNYSFNRRYEYITNENDDVLTLTNKTLGDVLHISSPEEMKYYNWICPDEDNECLEETIIPNYVEVKIFTFDGGWRGFGYVYDTEENRNIFNFTKIETNENMKVVQGDLNENGKVDLQDIIILLKKYLKTLEITNKDLLTGDMDGDGSIGIKDIILLLRAYLNAN